MQLRVTLDLPTDLAGAGRMLADPGYVRAKVAATGDPDGEVVVAGSPADGFTVTTRRSLPTDQIPAQLRSFVGARIDVRQVEAWDEPDEDGRHGTVVVEVVGAPVRLTGRTSLRAVTPYSCTLTYDGELRAAVPLFGAAVEKAAAGAVRDALVAEQAVAAQWLAENAH
ncbi:DUF2505 domain-containing protein [Cellulomonas sp. SG140]|uniref:DUF2505 domain-containing protein n=1 Tax=Cellulomonas sp. SG140 TaxID=2976536 RepID=UPI0021E9809D|nr:DUF2505 domain-containing protein [Cellulomonas sp. SG140]